MFTVFNLRGFTQYVYMQPYNLLSNTAMITLQNLSLRFISSPSHINTSTDPIELDQIESGGVYLK